MHIDVIIANTNKYLFKMNTVTNTPILVITYEVQYAYSINILDIS